MKKIVALIIAMVMVMTISAAMADTVNVYALKGPTGIGMVKLMNDNQGQYEFTLAGSPDEVVAAVASGSADIAAVPTNLAAALYNKTSGGVQLLALNTLGVLHIMENGDTIHDVKDLAGKTIYVTGQGSTPEYVLNYILEANDLSDSVKVEFVGEHSELATMASEGTVDLVMLPEPNVTAVLMKNSEFHIALDVTELFNEAAASKGQNAVLSMGCIIVNKEFAEKNPDAIATFMEEYQSSVEFVVSNVDEAADMVEAQGIIPKAAIAKKAIPNCHITFVSGQDMVDQIKPFFEVLFNANPKSVGGKLPEDDFYFVK